LPHREIRRERRKKDFIAATVLTVAGAAALAFLVGLVIDQQIDAQRARNDFISAENRKLDARIKEIATLRADIDALRARQQAVQSLQSNRTIPVHLLDELVQQVPEGTMLRSIRQDEGKVTLVGLAQSNERISNLLRNLARESPWLARPELLEIKAVDPSAQAGKGERREVRGAARVYEFSLNALLTGGPGDAAPTTAPGETGQKVAVRSTGRN
jgi:type IV pilus assembly protein PilN